MTSRPGGIAVVELGRLGFLSAETIASEWNWPQVRRLASACALLLAVRVVWILWLGSGDIVSGGDHAVYYKTARRLLEIPGEWMRPGSEFGYRAPLLFLVLAGVMGVTGLKTFALCQIVNSVLGVLSALLLFLLAERLAGRRVAWIAFWIRGLLPCFVIADTFVLSEPLFALLLLVALLAVAVRQTNLTYTRCAVAGIAIGAAWLTREAALPLPALFGLFLLTSGAYFRLGIQRAGVFAAATLLTLSPWLIRNEVVWDSAFPISHTSGVNLHIGNNAVANGRWVDPPKEGMPDTIRFGTPQFNQWHAEQAKKFIKENPSAVVLLGFKKIAWFLWPRFPRYDMSVVYPKLKPISTPISLIVGASSALLIVAGVIGAVLVTARERFSLLLLGIVVAYLGVTFLVVGHPRYRDALDHFLILTSATLLVNLVSHDSATRAELAARLRQRKGMVIVSMLLLLTAWTWAGLRY